MSYTNHFLTDSTLVSASLALWGSSVKGFSMAFHSTHCVISFNLGFLSPPVSYLVLPVLIVFLHTLTILKSSFSYLTYFPFSANTVRKQEINGKLIFCQAAFYWTFYSSSKLRWFVFIVLLSNKKCLALSLVSSPLDLLPMRSHLLLLSSLKVTIIPLFFLLPLIRITLTLTPAVLHLHFHQFLLLCVRIQLSLGWLLPLCVPKHFWELVLASVFCSFPFLNVYVAKNLISILLTHPLQSIRGKGE